MNIVAIDHDSSSVHLNLGHQSLKVRIISLIECNIARDEEVEGFVENYIFSDCLPFFYRVLTHTISDILEMLWPLLTNLVVSA